MAKIPLVKIVGHCDELLRTSEIKDYERAANGLQVESAISAAARDGLAQRGHTVTQSVGAYGGYQGILLDPRSGVLMGGSDVRKDGLAIGY